MRYLSTRGEAPRLNFCDAMLAGLARDGGLYVPERVPTLAPAAIRALSGSALRRSGDPAGRAVRRRGLCAPTNSRDLARDAYSGFRHAATAPLIQIDDNLFVLELFHGPTLAFKDFAMQWLGRAMNRALERRDRRATILGATSGDTGAAAIEAFGGQPRTDVFILFPHGRVSDVQRRQMTTVDKAERPCDRHRGLVRRLPGDRQGAVRRSRVSRRTRPVAASIRSTGRASSPRSSITSPARSRSARRSGASSFAVPTGNFGDVLAGYYAKAHGPAGRAADDRHQRERHSRPHARHRRLQAARRQGDPIAVDGHPGLLEFRAAAVRRLRPRRERGSRLDGRR